MDWTDLKFPNPFSLAPLISRRPEILSLPVNMRLRVVPAFLLTMLFYLDQNISIRTVNGFKMKKGDSYHLDMLVLAGVVLLLSVSGLPWVCGATVQSLNHVRAMARIRKDENDMDLVEDIVENRVSGFLTHAFLLCSLLLLLYIRQIPVPVISGIFLYFQVDVEINFREDRVLPVMLGFSGCIKEESKSIFKVVKPFTVAKYVSIQALMLSLIWILSQLRLCRYFSRMYCTVDDHTSVRTSHSVLGSRLTFARFSGLGIMIVIISRLKTWFSFTAIWRIRWSIIYCQEV